MLSTNLWFTAHGECYHCVQNCRAIMGSRSGGFNRTNCTTCAQDGTRRPSAVYATAASYYYHHINTCRDLRRHGDEPRAYRTCFFCNDRAASIDRWHREREEARRVAQSRTAASTASAASGSQELRHRPRTSNRGA